MQNDDELPPQNKKHVAPTAAVRSTVFCYIAPFLRYPVTPFEPFLLPTPRCEYHPSPGDGSHASRCAFGQAHSTLRLPPPNPATPPSSKLPSSLRRLHQKLISNTRRYTTTMASEERAQPLRLGSIAPNFQAETTNGPIDFHEFIGDNWVVLFSHPEDYTPVCTTELGAFAKLEPEFTKRGVKLIGLSANTIGSHEGWIKDIDEISGSKLSFPIIGDKDRKVAYLYDM